MKKKSYIIIIGIVAILLIIAMSVGGYFIFKNKEDDKSDDKGWIDTYYETLLKDLKENKVYTDAENVSIQFVGTPDSDLPIMVVSYEKNNKKRINEYGVAKNKEGYTSWLMSKYDSDNYNYDLQLLYDIEHQKYIWFVHSAGFDALGEDESFYAVNYRSEGIGYNFLSEEMKENQTEGDGTPILSKYEESLIKTDYNQEPIKIGDIQDIDAKKLKESINVASKEYKEIDDIITKETKKTTQNKLTEIESRKEQIKVANEEKANKKAEEEAAKKAQEEADKKAAEEAAKNGFKVGKYTMMYGTYIGSGGFQNDNVGRTMVLNPNGTYTITKNGSTSNGTFTVSSDGYIDFDNRSWSYIALGNNVFGAPAGAGYDEKFTYSGN